MNSLLGSYLAVGALAFPLGLGLAALLIAREAVWTRDPVKCVLAVAFAGLALFAGAIVYQHSDAILRLALGV